MVDYKKPASLFLPGRQPDVVLASAVLVFLDSTNQLMDHEGYFFAGLNETSTPTDKGETGHANDL
jgi:hypothetical protein